MNTLFAADPRPEGLRRDGSADIPTVALREHGRLIVRHRRSGRTSLWLRLRRLVTHHFLHQPARYHARLFLLHIRS